MLEEVWASLVIYLEPHSSSKEQGWERPGSLVLQLHHQTDSSSFLITTKQVTYVSPPRTGPSHSEHAVMPVRPSRGAGLPCAFFWQEGHSVCNPAPPYFKGCAMWVTVAGVDQRGP